MVIGGLSALAQADSPERLRALLQWLLRITRVRGQT